MANYSTASLVKAQLKLINNFAKPEKRFRIPEVHNLFIRSGQIMVPNYEEVKTSDTRVLETNYFLRTVRALGSARSHDHTGAQGDSGTLTPSWATYDDKFVSLLKEANNKIYSLEEMHMDKMENVIANFADGLDAVASAALFGFRTGVNAMTAEGTFNITDDVFQITESSNGNRAVQITKAMMDVNGYQAMGSTYVCDTIAFNKFEFDFNQGGGNSVNTSFQFGGVTFIHDPALTAAAAGLAGAYAKGFWIVVPEGTIAGLPWIPVQNRQGIVTKENMYGTIINPVDSLQYGVHSYEERVNGVAQGGELQDLKVETQVFIDMAHETAPINVSTETAQYAVGLV